MQILRRPLVGPAAFPVPLGFVGIVPVCKFSEREGDKSIKCGECRCRAGVYLKRHGPACFDRNFPREKAVVPDADAPPRRTQGGIFDQSRHAAGSLSYVPVAQAAGEIAVRQKFAVPADVAIENPLRIFFGKRTAQLQDYVTASGRNEGEGTGFPLLPGEVFGADESGLLLLFQPGGKPDPFAARSQRSGVCPDVHTNRKRGGRYRKRKDKKG